MFLQKFTQQDSKGATFLHPEKMSQWMQSVVNKVDLNKLMAKYPEILEVL